MTADSSRPSEGQAAPDWLLDATERLWESSPPSQITMRRIAAEAGRSLGLAYNYVASREELFALVLERIGNRLSVAVKDAPEEERLAVLHAAMEANPAFTRIMTWFLLEGVRPADHVRRFPMVADIAADARDAGIEDPELVGGVLAFMGISMSLYGPVVNQAMEVADRDPRLGAVLEDMYVEWARRATGGADAD